MYGDGNAWTGEARLYLGLCLLRVGKAAEGQALIREGRPQFTRAAGEDHFAVRLADDALQTMRH